MSRAIGRLLIFSKAIPALLLKPFRKASINPRKILIAHNLRLGDTIMLLSLIKKARQQYPAAEIYFCCSPAAAELYSTNPYGVKALSYNPRLWRSVLNILKLAPFDLAVVPGDNRYAWLALAAGSRWIIAHQEEPPTWKSYPVNQVKPYPDTEINWADLVATLIDGDGPQSYKPEEWPLPVAALAENPAIPKQPYVVLHVGASNPTRYWSVKNWSELAVWLTARGYQPVWSAGQHERHLVQEIDPNGLGLDLSGKLSLIELRALIEFAALTVCTDTGISHLAKLTKCPIVVLYGPGNPALFDAGKFWASSPYYVLFEQDVTCRDQHVMFKRERHWISRCGRGIDTCINLQKGKSACMEKLKLNELKQLIRRLIGSRE